MEALPEIIAPAFALEYIKLVKEAEPMQALAENSRVFPDFLRQIPVHFVDYAYAEGKWTIEQSLQHIIDAERVFTFRAVWFARNEHQPLPGFDENAWALHADVTGRNWNDMIDEFEQTRKSTQMLFGSFGREAWQARGVANNNPISVVALCYICSGHVAHHMNIIRDRYLSQL